MKQIFAEIVSDPQWSFYLMTAVVTFQVWLVKRVHAIECTLSIIKDRLKIKEH